MPTGGKMSGITWRAEDSLTSQQAINFLRDQALESRLSSLRDVAMELLSAVESLKNTAQDNGNNKLKLQDEVRRFEADLIRTALVRTAGNQARAAKLLGVKHTTLNAKIKRYGIGQGALTQGRSEEIAA
jgi:DNA-binding NtrC family response regulator